MTTQSRIELLEEAVAIEKAGGYWQQKHAAAVTGNSPRTLRSSDCPKSYEDGQGEKGKARVVYVPADVREWMRRRLRKSA